MNQVTLSWVNIKFHLRSMNFRTFRWDCHLYRTHWTNGVPNKSAMTRLINDGTSGQSFAKISSPTLLVYTWNLHEALLNILNKEKLILTVSPAWNTIMKFTIYNIQLLEKLELFLLLSPPNFSSSPYSHSSLSLCHSITVLKALIAQLSRDVVCFRGYQNWVPVIKDSRASESTNSYIKLLRCL